VIQEYIKKRKAELEKLTEKFITDNEQDEIYARQDELNKLSGQLEPLVMQKIADFTPEKFLDELDQYNEDMPYHTIGDYEVSNLWTDEQVKWMLNKYYQLKSNFTA